MRETTRERILETARRLGYDAYSNRHARAMAASRFGRPVKTGVIAALLGAPNKETALGSPFYGPVLHGIERCAGERGYDLFLGSMRDVTLPRYVQPGNVDGVVLLASGDVVRQVANTGLPMVEMFASLSDAPCIFIDDREGTRLATQHLIELGHRRIAYLGLRDDFHVGVERLAGYANALTAAGIAVDETIIAKCYGWRVMGRQAMQETLQAAPDITAIVCYNDMFAVEAIYALRAAGLSVPGDVSITGFDDLSHDLLFEPAITSVTWDRPRMGELAVNRLCMVIEAESAPDADGRDVVPVNLAVHDTTSPPRAS